MQYATPVSKKALKALPTETKEGEEKKLSNHAQRNLDARKKGACILWTERRGLTCRLKCRVED